VGEVENLNKTVAEMARAQGPDWAVEPLAAAAAAVVMSGGGIIISNNNNNLSSSPTVSTVSVVSFVCIFSPKWLWKPLIWDLY
jgi:hypothetical protein